MTATEITWVAALVEPGELDAARALACTLGWATLVSSPAQEMFQTPRGDVIEYCTIEHPAPVYLFAHQRTAVGFKVDDLPAAAADLIAAGFRAAGEVVNAGPVRFQHFHGPGGGIFGVIAAPFEASGA